MVPIHAQGFFTVSINGLVTQVTVFDYFDPMEYYAGLLEGSPGLEEEYRKLSFNMQEFLNDEKVFINKKRVKPKVKGVDICLRGERDKPSIVFIIIFKGVLKPGINLYEDFYEETEAEYDYEFYWVFPPGVTILEAEMPGDYEIIGDNILMVWVRKGEHVEGAEKISFWIPEGLLG